MMTRAERAMELYASIYPLERLQQGSEDSVVRFKLNDLLADRLATMHDEYRELKRQMGWSDWKEFARLKLAWAGIAERVAESTEVVDRQRVNPVTRRYSAERDG